MKRDMSDAMLWGVCSGIAKHFDTDVTIIRLGFVGATLFFGAPILIYPIMALILPKE
jgi:phage shock protein C